MKKYSLDELNDRMKDGMLNVKWFGAVPGGDAEVNRAAIQAALDIGGNIYVPAGRYDISAVLRIQNSNVTVFGDGSATIFDLDTLQASTTTEEDWLKFMLFSIEGTSISSKLSNIHLKDFTISMSKMGDTIDTSQITRLINTIYTSNMSVHNITCSTFGAFTTFRGSDNFHVHNNSISALCIRSDDAHADAQIAAWDLCLDYSIRDNYFNGKDSNTSIRQDHMNGISLSGGTDAGTSQASERFSVTGNKFTGFSACGIWMDGREDYHKDVIVEGNIISDCRTYGIRLGDVKRGLIANNIVSDCTGAGIVLDKSSTPLTGDWSPGIGCLDISITGNTLYRNAQSSGTPVQIRLLDETKEVFIDSNLVDCGSVGYAAILGPQTERVKIGNNHVSNRGIGIIDNQAGVANPLASNKYSPGLTDGDNIVSTQNYPCIYNVSGGIVTVTGEFDFVANLIDTYTHVEVSLPFVGNTPIADLDLNGVIGSTTDLYGVVQGNGVDYQANVNFYTKETTGTVKFNFSYNVNGAITYVLDDSDNYVVADTGAYVISDVGVGIPAIVNLTEALEEDKIMIQGWPRKAVGSVSDMIEIAVPIDDDICSVQAYHADSGEGGGVFIYDSTLTAVNDGGMVLNGWVRQTNEINVLMFGATPDNIDSSDAFEKAALYAAQFELGDSKMPAINITKGTYRVTRAMPIATWVLGTGVVITGNGSVDPSFAEDTTYLTGSVIDFNGVNQGNTLRVGDPAFVHQKALGKAVGGEVIGASDTGSGGLGGISHASGASGVQQGCIGVTASVVNDQDGWAHPTWGLYAEVTQTTGHGALWGAEFTTRKPEGSVTQVKSPYNNQNPTIDGSAYCATFTAGGGEYIPGGDNFNYYPQNITAFIGMSAKGGAQADKGIIIDDGSIATSQAIVMPNEYSIMHYTSDTETINTLRNGNKSKIIVRSDDLNAAALLEHHKKPTSGETNVDDKLSVIRAFGEYVGSEVALSTRRVTQTTAFNSGTGTASSELVEEVSSSTSTSKRGTRLHYNDLAPTVTNVMSLGNATYTWNKVFAVTYNAGGLNGATGSFTSQDGKTITVTGGIITSII